MKEVLKVVGFSLLFSVVLIGVLSLYTARFRECRTQFSFMYCISGK